MGGKALKAKTHGEFHQKHSLGQNFIEDEALLEQLAELSLVTQEDCVLEIGPGFGALTKPLARRAKEIVSLEIDRALIPILRVALDHCPNVRVICGDVMKTDLAALTGKAFGENASLRVAANLPYYITTDVLTKLLTDLPQARSIAVMVQKEVGDKLLSIPGDEGYGPLALFSQYFCHVSRALDVPAACFTPVPKVDSSFMVLERRSAPPFPVENEALLLKLIKSAFAMRRKTLVNNLVSGFQISRETAGSCLEAAQIGERARAQEVGLESFCRLAGQLSSAARAVR